MLLAVDIGNTAIKFGIFDLSHIIECVSSFSVSSKVTRSSDEYELIIRQLLSSRNLDGKIDRAVISSVAPSITNSVKKATSAVSGSVPFIIGAGTRTGFKIKTEDPSELGADIVSNAAAALAMSDAPVVVADLGTATTLTAINRDKEILGTIIVPGAGVSLDALSNSAELLSKVSVARPDNLIGTNTVDSITSGVINGNIYMIDGFVRNLREQLCAEGEKLSLIATGGMCETIIPHCRNKFNIVKDLTLIGAAWLFKNNRR